MSTNPDYIAIDIAISFEDPAAMQAFIDRMTGNDDDILLLAEKAMNARLGVESYVEGVQVQPPSADEMQRLLDDHLEAKERKRRRAMVALQFDAEISELQRRKDAALAELS